MSRPPRSGSRATSAPSADSGSARTTGSMLRSRLVILSTALVLLAAVGGCTTPDPNATPKPAIEIQNMSGRPLDVFSLSPRGGQPVRVITLQDGQAYGSEPAGNECEASTYFVEAASRRIATLDRMGCVGASLVVTPEMLTGPVVVISAEDP